MKKRVHFPHHNSSLTDQARHLRREMADAERKLWSHLRGNQMNVRFRRQVPFDQYILDFYCHRLSLVIEVDGGQHYSERGAARDQLRDFHLAEHGLHVLRFSDHDVLRNPEGVLNRIYEEVSHRLKLNPALKETPSQSPPRGEEDDNLQPGNGMPLPL